MTRLAAARLAGTGSGLLARPPAAKPPVPEDETGVIGTEPDEAAGVPEDIVARTKTTAPDKGIRALHQPTRTDQGGSPPRDNDKMRRRDGDEEAHEVEVKTLHRKS